MKLLIVAAIALVPSPAIAAPAAPPAAPPAATPSFELIERGDAVEIIARNVKATRTAINPVRSRLEVEVVGRPRANALTPRAGHKPVVIVELDNEPRSLSVKLAYSYADVKTLARFAQAMQVGDDLHLMFPRNVPAADATVVLPEPTLPPELAAKLAAATRSDVKPDLKPDLRPDLESASKSETKSESKPELKPAGAPLLPEPPSPITPATTEKLSLPSGDSGGLSRTSLFGLLGLAAVGLGVWFVRRKKTVAPTSTIEVLAQRSLGGKAKLVWVSIGEREMVVAVTQQQVRMLGQWPRGQQPQGSGPMSYANFDEALQKELPAAQVVDRKAHTDPARSAVAGLVKLRARTASQVVPQMNEEQAAAIIARSRTASRVVQRTRLDDDLATEDAAADELWAREIVAATGSRR